MKKLLAMLLTLAMLVPMMALAEETAPGATLTTITFRDFDAEKLLGSEQIDEATQTAYRDLLDSLRVEHYRQGLANETWALFLNDQLIVDYGVQARGADVYVSSNLLGETLYLNLDEDMRHLGDIAYRYDLSQRVSSEEDLELRFDAFSELAEQRYENMGALLAKIAKNPLITGEMQPEDAVNGLFETDWTWANQRVNQLVKGIRVESVTNPPEGCQSAKNVFYFTLSNEQLVEMLCVLLNTAEGNPAVKAYFDLLNTYRQMLDFVAADDKYQPIEDTDWQTWLRQQTLLVEDAQVVQYVDASMRLLRMVVSYKVAPTNTPTLAQDTLLDATFTIDIYPLQGVTLLKWRQETAGKGTSSQLWMNDSRVALLVMPDDDAPTSYSYTVSPLDNGANILLQMIRSTGVEMPGLSWSASIDTRLVDGEEQQDADVQLLWQGEQFLTIAVETRPCDSRPLLSDGDVLDLGEISNARFNAYMTGVMFNAGQILPRVMMNLPDSVRQLTNSVQRLITQNDGE